MTIRFAAHVWATKDKIAAIKINIFRLKNYFLSIFTNLHYWFIMILEGGLVFRVGFIVFYEIFFIINWLTTSPRLRRSNAFLTSCRRSTLATSCGVAHLPSERASCYKNSGWTMVPRIPAEWLRKGCACLVSAFGGFLTYFLQLNNLNLTFTLRAWGSSPLCVYAWNLT